MPAPRKRLFRGPVILGGSFLVSFILGGAVAALLPAPAPSSSTRANPENAPERKLAQIDPALQNQDVPLEVTPTDPAVNCQPGRSVATNGITRFVKQTATWVEQPEIGIGALIQQVGPQVMAYLNAAPFPQIHAQAQQARVPVMMYHDILAEKQVFFDRTPEEFEAHLKLIQAKGVTPISMDQLVTHLRTGLPLPEKPILLTFDDGYAGHYEYVYPLLKKYNYPAVFSIYTAKVGKKMGRSSITWEQLREMAADPLVTIASHSVTHKVMPTLTAAEVERELVESKRTLEQELGILIRYFTYPEGKYTPEIATAVQAAGYLAALTMDDADERLAGQSESLLAIGRIGQSRLEEMVDVAWGGPRLPVWSAGFNFDAPIEKMEATIDNTPFVFIRGGRPITIHADTRYQVPEILAKWSGTGAIAAVDGTFFSLELLDSNELLGPVLSQSTGQFIPGKRGEIPFLSDRPLVLIGANGVKFVPFSVQKHNTLEGIQAEMPDVTDAFVAAGWLVDDGIPQPLERFGRLYSVNELRHRAFWGITQDGQAKIGVSVEPIGSVDLGKALAKAGFRYAVMLDSGASTSLAYRGASLVGYTPRPVPHVVALVPPGVQGSAATCAMVSADRSRGDGS